MPVSAAIDELVANAGAQFDPRVVEAVVAVVGKAAVHIGPAREPIPDRVA
jgi:HD-GYP domain-containing protein (c-di-GMP phosphodiesterase class II)